MTLKNLVDALIQNAAIDGETGAEEYSPALQRDQAEILRRCEAVIAEFGDRARAILDGKA